MPFSHYQNLKVECWFYSGRSGAAHDCLCVEHTSTDQGREILEALSDLKRTGGEARRKLTFAPTNRRNAIEQLALELTPARAELKVMNIRRNGAAATIEMTSEGNLLVADAVAAWLGGGEDFGVSSKHSTSTQGKEFGRLDRDSMELWFWGPSMGGPG